MRGGRGLPVGPRLRPERRPAHHCHYPQLRCRTADGGRSCHHAPRYADGRSAPHAIGCIGAVVPPSDSGYSASGFSPIANLFRATTDNQSGQLSKVTSVVLSQGGGAASDVEALDAAETNLRAVGVDTG